MLAKSLLGATPFGQQIPFAWRKDGYASGTTGMGQAFVPSLDAPGTASAFDGRAELIDWDTALSYWNQWTDLTARAVEPNVFLEPGFALSCVQHVPAARRPMFLATWAGKDRREPGDLTGLFALQIPKRGTGRIARMWLTPMMASGSPLLDREQGSQAVKLLLDYLAAHHDHIDALVLPDMALEGETARMFLRHAEENKLGMQVLEQRTRAVVSNNASADEFLNSFISPKKRKELRRQRRRLEEIGPLTYTSARTQTEVRDAMERFLTLEASGWKGGQHSALLSDPSTATFARAMTRFLARDGGCRIDALEIGGVPVAMGIVLTAGENAFFWKTAFDERHARHSPGVLFAMELTENLIRGGEHRMINSCAMANHPMIDHIWRERIEMGDLCIATPGTSRLGFKMAVASETMRRGVRMQVKNAYNKIRSLIAR